MSGKEPSAAGRVVAGGMVGAAVGMLVGIVVLGGIILAPVVITLLGAAAGVSISARRAGVDALSTLGLRTTPASAARARRQAPSAGHGPADRPARPATGIVRLPGPPRTDVQPVDVNTAGVEQLTWLPGVGRAAAARIVAHRERHGPFGSVAELSEVEGFDLGRVARLQPLATLSSPGDQPAAAAGGGAQGPSG